MQEVVVFIGLQGAGKSTFHAQRFAESHVLISKDRFRNNRRPGLYFEEYQKDGYDPKRRQAVTATRRRVKVDGDLPLGEDYARFIARMVS